MIKIFRPLPFFAYICQMILFDLDDTLFPEIDYVHSAYRAIAARWGVELLPLMLAAPSVAEAFELVTATRPDVTITEVIGLYRTHWPGIHLPWQSLYTLAMLRNTGESLGIITDGRSVTQRHKIEALGLDRFVKPEHIIISEEIGGGKTTPLPFESISGRCSDEKFTYIGDNPAKDFTYPASMGWRTVCLLNAGCNIHPQDLSQLPSATITIRSLTELLSPTLTR